ncbi:hypothetical protein [Ktedonospora formicarum]|uniref:hypothetical protein n=1 Tax=Ktedonospora formicarum TaxID=2778364 RepID=UPI001C6893DF|nr:hypothetical protein [Ktedonospora formicarum]
MDSLLVVSTLRFSFLFSISYFLPITLRQFANNILLGLYHVLSTNKKSTATHIHLVGYHAKGMTVTVCSHLSYQMHQRIAILISYPLLSNYRLYHDARKQTVIERAHQRKRGRPIPDAQALPAEVVSLLLQGTHPPTSRASITR